jgi:hypothetical protein
VKKINSSYTERDCLEDILTEDMRKIGLEISNMSQKKFRRGDSELVKYYKAFHDVVEFYGFKRSKM